MKLIKRSPDRNDGGAGLRNSSQLALHHLGAPLTTAMNSATAAIAGAAFSMFHCLCVSAVRFRERWLCGAFF